MSKIGYIRVSTEHQETARQQEIMCDYQVDRIFSEKMSGANANRPQLKTMIDYVRESDTLYIESISRLGRSTKDLLNIISKSFVSIALRLRLMVCTFFSSSDFCSCSVLIRFCM